MIPNIHFYPNLAHTHIKQMELTTGAVLEHKPISYVTNVQYIIVYDQYSWLKLIFLL